MIDVDGPTRFATDAAAWDENDLARATNAGERGAADVLFTRSMPTLLNLSRAIAGRAMEAEELLAVALLSTWEKWSQGRGPVENAHAYIAQTMRNRLRDEMRAPRSRNVALDDANVHEFAHHDETDRIHAAIDNEIVGVAFARLSDEQRMLLTEVLVNGRKPQEVARELGRSSGRVSSAVYRAKAALRTELVAECLRRACPGAGCGTDQEGIALLIGAKHTWNAGHPAVAAAHECPGCRAGLQAYAALPGAQSVTVAA